MRSVLLLTFCVLLQNVLMTLPAQAQAASAPATAAPAVSDPAAVRASRSGDRTTLELPASVTTDAAVACKASKTLRIVRPVAAAQPGPVTTEADPTLIQYAQANGRKLVLTDAKCDANGALVASGVSVEPAPLQTSLEEFCKLPEAKQKSPRCR